MTTAAERDLAHVDLLDPGWFADGPPHDLFARMRAEAPVRWNATQGQGFWSLTRHDAVADIAVPIPLGVLAQLMGLSDDDVPRLYEWTEQIEAAQRAPEPAAALDVFVEMAGFLHEQITRQVQEGNVDSLVMRLRNAE